MVFVTENILKDVLGVAVAVLVVIVAYYKWSFTYWKRRGVEHPPPSIPFGNIRDVFYQKTSFWELYEDIYRDYKSKGLKYCGVYFFTSHLFLPIDLDLIKTMMTTDFQYFTDHGNYINEKKEPLTGHLFNLKGLKWKNLRAKLTPTFTSGKMKMMFHTLVDCSHGLLEVTDKVIDSNNFFDIKDIVQRYTTDVIGSCAFGLDCNSLKNPDSEFRGYGRRAFQFGKRQAILGFLSLSFPKVLEILNLTILPKDVHDFFMNIVKQTVEYREKNNVVRKDFLQLLIQLKNNVEIKDDEHGEKCDNDKEKSTEVGKTLTINELAAQVFVFFIAGFETSSATLTFCFYELATNFDVQDKLRKEINEVLDKHKGELTYEAIMEMQYMDKCVQETLRKYPPLPILIRECTKVYRIPDTDVVIEKGTLAFIPILGIQRDPEYYADPEKFDPERFSSENKANRHAFTWLPFGEGPRACIGLRFGIMQIKVALAVLLKHYKFTLDPKTPSPLVFDTTSGMLNPRGDILLNVEKLAA